MVSTVQSLDSTDEDAPQSAEQWFESLYADLRRLAQSQLRRGPAVSIGATALLHEAYLDLSAREPIRCPDRARFMAYAARAMRGLVIDYARQRRAQKRGGAFHLTSIDTQIADQTPDPKELAGIGEALDALAKVDPALAELVDLRFFGGFAIADIAELRGVSERTVQRDWLKARLYLRRTLRDGVF